MKTVLDVRKALLGHPDSAACYAYEGEVGAGIVIVNPSEGGTNGWISTPQMVSGPDEVETPVGRGNPENSGRDPITFKDPD